MLDIYEGYERKSYYNVVVVVGGAVTSGESMSEYVGLPSIFSFSCTVSVFSSPDTV